jgi:hypothetical protein
VVADLFGMDNHTIHADSPPSDALLRCPVCTYDLSGAVSSICPECGSGFEIRAAFATRGRALTASSIVGGVLLAFVIWAFFYLQGGSIRYLIDPISMLFVVGGTFSFGLVVCGRRGLINAGRALLKPGLPKHTRRRAITDLRLLAAFSVGLGFFGALVGVVFLLSSLDDISMVGPGIAVTVLTQFWGLVLALALIAASFLVSRREPARHTDARATTVMLAVAAAGACCCLLSIAVIVVALRVFVDLHQPTVVSGPQTSAAVVTATEETDSE